MIILALIFRHCTWNSDAVNIYALMNKIVRAFSFNNKRAVNKFMIYIMNKNKLWM